MTDQAHKLTPHARFVAAIEAEALGNHAEYARLRKTAETRIYQVTGAELAELLNAARALALYFLQQWHQGRLWHVAGMQASARTADKIGDPMQTPEEKRDNVRRHEQQDELQHKGRQKLLALSLAWQRFCDHHELPGEAILTVHLGDVFEEVATEHARWIHAALEEVHPAGAGYVGLHELAETIRAELCARWPECEDNDGCGLVVRT